MRFSLQIFHPEKIKSKSSKRGRSQTEILITGSLITEKQTKTLRQGTQLAEIGKVNSLTAQ